MKVRDKDVRYSQDEGFFGSRKQKEGDDRTFDGSIHKQSN